MQSVVGGLAHACQHEFVVFIEGAPIFAIDEFGHPNQGLAIHQWRGQKTADLSFLKIAVTLEQAFIFRTIDGYAFTSIRDIAGDPVAWALLCMQRAGGVKTSATDQGNKIANDNPQIYHQNK